MRFIACLIGVGLAVNIAIDSTRPAIELFIAWFSMPLFIGFALKEYLKNSSKKD